MPSDKTLHVWYDTKEWQKQDCVEPDDMVLLCVSNRVSSTLMETCSSSKYKNTVLMMFDV